MQTFSTCTFLLFLKVIPGCQNLTGYWAPGHGILVHTSDGKPSKMRMMHKMYCWEFLISFCIPTGNFPLAE